MGLLSTIAGWWNKMFSKRTIETALDVTVVTSPEMQRAQDLWRSMFMGRAPWNDDDNPSLHIASGLCTEVARAVTIEMESIIEGSARAKWLNEQYQREVNKARQTVEKLCSNGRLVLRPFVRANGGIYVTAVENNCYYPLRYNDLDELVEVVFTDTLIREKDYYTLLEHCDYNEVLQTFTYQYTAYKSNNSKTLGVKIPLSLVEEWADLPPTLTFYNVDMPWYVELVMPSINTVDQLAPDGMALFSKSVDLIKEADKQFGRTVWEYEGGELAIDASVDYFKRSDHNKPGERPQYQIPHGKKRLFRMNEANSDNSKMEVFSPAFRDTSLYNGLNQILRRIEFNSGVAYGTISDEETVQKTATEINKQRERSYSTVSDIQKVMQTGYEKLLKIFDTMATLYLLAPDGDYDATFHWDDSIIETKEEKQAAFDAELKRLQSLVAIAVVSPAEVRAFLIENSDYFHLITPEMIEQAEQTLPEPFDDNDDGGF